MVKILRSNPLRLAALLLACAVGAGVAVWITPLQPVSKPGEYRGKPYSERIYTEWVRTSQYISGRDGTRLAADIYRPARAGIAIQDPMPVILRYERYQRASLQDGKVVTPVTRSARLQELIKHGYVVAIVDVRGGGGSFGTRNGPFSQPEAWDGHSIIEWFASQPWCDGNIAMMGVSYRGIAQYFAAATAPPNLKAIFPVKAMFDFYDFAHPGGIYREDVGIKWSQLTRSLLNLTSRVIVKSCGWTTSSSSVCGVHSNTNASMEHQAAISSSRTPLMNFTFSMTSPRRR